MIGGKEKDRCPLTILVNPGGKEGKYRAVDWCVELDNLLTKVRSLQTHAFYTGCYIL
jgi:hypothetical protein